MYTAVTELTVSPGNRPEFEQAFTASMKATLTAVPGLRRSLLLRPNEDDRSYLAVLEFTDKDAYQAYLASDAFHSAHHGQRRVFADSHRLSTYTDVAG